MIKFRIINRDDIDSYQLYCQAYTWDKKHFFTRTRATDSYIREFSKNFALYKDEEFIGYGSFEFNDSIDEDYLSKVNLSYIIKPEYRKKGYGNKLLQYLLDQAKQIKTLNIIEVEILKKNLASISLIEKHDFNFKYFDDKKIVFQKTIKK